MAILASKGTLLLTTVTLVSAFMAGCAGEEDAATGAEATSSAAGAIDPGGEGRDLRTDLTALDQLPAPQWKVADWFGHHVFLGVGDEAGFHIDTVVVADEPSRWIMATDNAEVAKFEVMFDIPIVGPIAKSDLSTTGFGSAWDLYDFPLYDGKVWNGQFTAVDFEDGEETTYGLTFRSTYAESISTPDGPRPGFEIEAVTDSGGVLLAYDFVPDIGWYAHFFYYDIESDEPDDFNFHVMSMGHGANWEGTYYVDTGGPLIQHFNMVAVDTSTTPPGVVPAANPTDTFTMSADATHLIGLYFSFAESGAHEMLLVDPNHEYHEWQSVGSPAEDQEEGFVDLEAVAGEWRIVTAGANGGGGMFLWEVVEVTGTLP